MPSKPLGDVCNILAGYGFPERLQGKQVGELPFFKVGDISEAWKRGDRLLGKANHYLSLDEATSIRAKPFPVGTVVFAKIGAAIALNRRAILSEPSLIDNNVMGLSPAGADLNERYLFHFMCTVQLDKLARATTVPSIRKGDVEQIEIPIPPLYEQRRIVAELETQLTRLDASVTALKRVQANLKRYRASVLKAACEGRLVPTEADLARREVRSYESGAELLIHLQADRLSGVKKTKKKLPQAVAVEIRLPEAPEGWAWAIVEELAATAPNSITDGPFGSNLKTEHYVDAGPRVIRLQNIGNGVFVDEEVHITSAHYERLTKHRVFAGDIVIAALGESPPRSCIVPEWLGPAIVKADCVRFKPHELLSAKFLSHVLNSEPTRARAKAIVHGIGRPRLNLGEIRSISLPIPPLAEQQRIVSEVERRLSVVDEVDAQVQANVARSDAMRSSLLRLAFNSELSEMTNGSK